MQTDWYKFCTWAGIILVEEGRALRCVSPNHTVVSVSTYRFNSRRVNRPPFRNQQTIVADGVVGHFKFSAETKAVLYFLSTIFTRIVST